MFFFYLMASLLSFGGGVIGGLIAQNADWTLAGFMIGALFVRDARAEYLKGKTEMEDWLKEEEAKDKVMEIRDRQREQRREVRQSKRRHSRSIIILDEQFTIQME